MNSDGKPKAAVVVVTGATGNLGAAVIARLQRDGACVVAMTRTQMLATGEVIADVDPARPSSLQDACFALAGFGCSAFFPLTVSLAAERIGGDAARAGSLLTAALMAGVGVGSFVIGPLRAGSSLAMLYACSAVYPLAALGLCAWLGLRGRFRSKAPMLTSL